MATLFFNAAFNDSKVTRAMQAVVALAIIGNIIVMTFTASRVKQELAKEGILPWSLFFSTGRTTATSWLRSRVQKGRYQAQPTSEKSADDPPPNPLEQSPIAALGLQWLSSLFLLAVTAGLSVKFSVSAQYNFLIALYSYVLVILVAFCTTTGLLYSKYVRRDWTGEYKPLGGPAAAVIFWLAALFVLITAFVPPDIPPSYHYYYLVPAIGLSALLWGAAWWGGMNVYMRWAGLKLIVTRQSFIQQEEENGEWTVRYELVKHRWMADIGANESDSEEGDVLL